MAMGVNTTNRIADQLWAHGIQTREAAKNATEAEWGMAADLARADRKPDQRMRNNVITLISCRAAQAAPVDEADVFAGLF